MATNEKRLVCVGPIWSHADYLKRKHEFERDYAPGPNWVMTGHWTSQGGTSYVEFATGNLYR